MRGVTPAHSLGLSAAREHHPAAEALTASSPSGPTASAGRLHPSSEQRRRPLTAHEGFLPGLLCLNLIFPVLGLIAVTEEG